MTSQTRQKIIAIHILSNIARSKDNQIIKFDQLIEYNMTNIIHYIRATTPRPFHESKLSISLDQSLKYYKMCFDCMPKSTCTILLLSAWKKKLLALYSINWPNFIAWLLLPLEILDNTWIVISCWSVCDVINFKINLSHFIKPFFYITMSNIFFLIGFIA